MVSFFPQEAIKFFTVFPELRIKIYVDDIKIHIWVKSVVVKEAIKDVFDKPNEEITTVNLKLSVTSESKEGHQERCFTVL